jgi:hypothetical protein
MAALGVLGSRPPTPPSLGQIGNYRAALVSSRMSRSNTTINQL